MELKNVLDATPFIYGKSYFNRSGSKILNTEKNFVIDAES
jgi:hypothetical protein